jgi:hypothetical protein
MSDAGVGAARPTSRTLAGPRALRTEPGAGRIRPCRPPGRAPFGQMRLWGLGCGGRWRGWRAARSRLDCEYLGRAARPSDNSGRRRRLGASVRRARVSASRSISALFGRNRERRGLGGGGRRLRGGAPGFPRPGRSARFSDKSRRGAGSAVRAVRAAYSDNIPSMPGACQPSRAAGRRRSRPRFTPPGRSPPPSPSAPWRRDASPGAPPVGSGGAPARRRS